MKLSLPLVATGLWLAAFIVSFPWVQFYEPETTALSLIALIAATALGDASGITKRAWPLPRSGILICGGLFWALALLSVLLSDMLFISWVYFFTFSALPLTIGLFLFGHDSAERLKVAWSGIKVLLAVLSVYAVVQYFALPETLYEGRVHEPLTDPNGLAAIFSLGLFMQLRALLIPRKRTWRDIALFFLIFIAFLVTGSRTAFIAFFLMMLVLFAAYGPRLLSRRDWMMFGGLGIVSVLSVSILTPTYFAGPLKLLYYSYENGWDFIFGSRGLLWSSTLDIIGAHLWTGTGIGTFHLYYPELRHAADTTAGFMAHNDPLQFGAEMGVIATIVFYVTVVLGIIRTIRSLRAFERHDLARLDILLPALGLGAFLLHTHMTFNLHVMACLFMFGYVTAVWHQSTGAKLSEKAFIFTCPAYFNDLVLKTGLLIVAFIMMCLAALPIYTQSLLRNADISLLVGDVQDFADKVNLANILSYELNSQPYAMASRIPLGALMQNEEVIPQQDRERMMKEAQALLESAARYNPRDVSVLRQKAQLARVRNEPQEEEMALRDALRLNPSYLSARMDLASLLERQKRDDEALAILVEGIERVYDPRKVDALRSYYLRTMMLLEAAGRGPEADAVREKVRLLFP